MSAQDRAIQKLARELAGIKKEVVSWRGPQADYTSIENGGNFTFKDSDGNVTAVVGGQDDGSNTIRHVDGPTPPVPSGLSAHVDGPIVQVSWDGTFESDVTHDWHYLEVLAVGPNNEQLTGTINDLSGGETSLAATAQGDWFITARSVSRAGKRSLDGDAGTASVQLVGLTGAIDAIQESANGKNTIYYSPTEPVAPEGGFNNGDLWFDTSEEGNNTASVWDGNGWVSMEDARLATIIAAQEALESDLTDVQTSVDGKNKITYDPALPPASYVGAVGDTWYRTSGNSMIGFWKWDGAAWVQQALSATVIPQIDIGAGTFGTLTGSRLAAQSVTADRLLVGGGSELMNDPFFDQGSKTWTPIGATWAGAGSGYLPDGAMPGHSLGTVLKPKTAQTNMTIYGPLLQNGFRVPVFPGEVYSCTLYVYATSPVSGTANSGGNYDGFNLQIYAYGTQTSGETAAARGFAASHRGTFPGGQWVQITGQYTVPAGVNFISPRMTVYFADNSAPITADIYVGRVSVVRASGATLIEDGAITTDKLAVGSITAESGVIASLDLGKATVGELDGIRIRAQTIRGQQLSGDAIDGKVITGPIIQSARTGQRWVGDATGIRIFNADNEVRTQLSPDGSSFKGEVEADTLVVNGGSELRSTENKLAQGAKLTLEAGVTDPTAPPVVQPYWDATEFTPGTVNGEPMKSVGLAWDGTNYWTAHSRAGAGGASSRMIVFRIDVSTGSGSFVAITIPHGTPYHSEIFGVTCIGSELFWLGRSFYEGMVWVTDLAGAFKRAFAYPNLGYSSSSPLGYKPGIGNDGTNVVIAHCSDVGALVIRTFNKTTGAQIGGSVADSGDGTKSDITGVYVGNADWGRKLVTVAKASTSELPAFSATTGVYDGAATKFGAASTGSVGVVFHDGKFHTLDPTGTIHEYADSNTGDGSGDWWATYYWYTDVDDGSVIESSDYQSRMAPPKRFTWPRRAGLKILGQPMPTGVEALGPALAKKTTEPVRTDFSGPGWKVDSGKPSARYVTLPTNWTTYASPSATNTFPEAESSVLESASGTFRLQGDGSGHWGPLTMGRNGVMSGLIVSGQVAITPDSANTVKQATVNLPAGRFSKPPVVWAQLNTEVPHWCSLGVYQPADTNNFDMFLVRTNTTTTDVYWFAMDSE